MASILSESRNICQKKKKQLINQLKSFKDVRDIIGLENFEQLENLKDNDQTRRLAEIIFGLYDNLLELNKQIGWNYTSYFLEILKTAVEKSFEADELTREEFKSYEECKKLIKITRKNIEEIFEYKPNLEEIFNFKNIEMRTPQVIPEYKLTPINFNVRISDEKNEKNSRPKLSVSECVYN